MVVLLPAFFVSGFCALLYQMIWQRVLTFFGGADVYSVTIIVAAFMAGLGVGSLAGGLVADRLTPRGCLLAFAAAEAAIAVFALVSLPLFYDFLYLRLGAAALPELARAALLFATLLVPTTGMGLSLPLLARALTTDLGVSADRIGGLYGWNTLGAAAGAPFAVFVLVRLVGFTGTVYVGAALNLLCALAGLFAGLRTPRGSVALPVAPEAPAPAMPRGIGRWIALYAVSGFVALSLEIVWFRLLGTILKSNAFTFAILLSLYLLGVGGGALVGRRLARRTARPERLFLLLQGCIPLYACVSLGALVFALGRVGALDDLWRYLGSYEPLDLGAALRALQRIVITGGGVAPWARDLVARFATLYGLVPLFLIVPPTLLMGMSFPVLQRAVQVDLESLGRRVGFLQAANIAGSTAGSVVTGLLLLDVLGTAATLRILGGVGVVFLLLGSGALARGEPGGRRLARAGGVALSALMLLASPAAPALWSRLHGTTAGVLFAEDGSGLSVLKEEEGRAPGTRETVVYVNGIGQSQLPFGGYHTLLGAFPVLLHPDPKHVVVIGLGSGDTLFGTGGRAETERMDCIEIIAPQLRTLRELDRGAGDAGLRGLLRDRRVSFRFGDGRAFLMRSEERADVVQADALRPTSAYSGNLYSLEYFELVRSRLREGGFGVTWGPTKRTRDTFVRAFPHALAIGDILIGSDRPIAFDVAALRRRIEDPHTVAYYARAGIDVRALLAPVLEAHPKVYDPGFDRAALTDLNNDLFPRDEYLVGETLFGPRRPAGRRDQ